MTSDRADTLAAETARIGKPPADTAIARLRHTLRVYEYEPDDREVLTATRNVYGTKGEPYYWTGITLGDLRDIAERLGV